MEVLVRYEAGSVPTSPRDESEQPALAAVHSLFLLFHQISPTMELSESQRASCLDLDSNKCVLFRRMLDDAEGKSSLGELTIGYESFLEKSNQSSERLEALINTGAGCWMGWPRMAELSSHTKKARKKLKNAEFEYIMVRIFKYG
ncbi:hypothetical protein QAD02_013193, partial [Eretmocerus hayati]